MAVPKRKVGRIVTNTRRSSHKIEAKNIQECPQCHDPKLPHTVCSSCGYYKGKEVIVIDD